MEKVLQKESNIKKIKENMLAFCAMLGLMPLNIFYVALNNSKREVHSLITSIDNAIPFVKIFIIPYVAWYGFIFFTMAYLCFKDKITYFQTLISYGMGLISSFITFYFFQTTVPRPELAGNGLLTYMVQIIYSADQPYNCFPSIHVLTSHLMVKGIMACSARNWKNCLVVCSTAVLIIISTLFIKQHVLLDVVFGIIYAELIFRLSQIIYKKVFNSQV